MCPESAAVLLWDALRRSPEAEMRKRRILFRYAYSTPLLSVMRMYCAGIGSSSR